MGSWIEEYGLWVVLVGGILEGEAVFVAAGYAASQGYLAMLPTLVVAALAGSLGDNLYYALGRRFGDRVLRWIPGGRRLREHARPLLARWGKATAFALRFAYGLRMILPATLGVVRYRWSIFLPLNLAASCCFALLYLSLGYLFGEAMEEYVGQMRGKELWVLAVVGALGLLFWTVREWRLLHIDRSRRAAKRRPESG